MKSQLETKVDGLRMLRELRYATREPDFDQSEVFWKRTGLREYSFEEIKNFSEVGISPASIGQTRSFLGHGDCYTGGNVTFEALLADSDSDYVKELLRVIAPVSINATGYDWFQQNKLI